MGTLTAGQQRLPGFCEHKLPTSCRLTSILNCCACADERAHAASYRTYIDGIGFVLRGTRWQRYCWFCREFWENRIEVSGLRPAQTRIPFVPDQTDFLERWYDFHRGYRVVTADDGTETRVAMLGEDFQNVSPGCLPRTLDELRAGRERSEAIPSQTQGALVGEEQQASGPSLDETLDQLYREASTDDNARQRSSGERPMRAMESTSPRTADSNDARAHALESADPRRREHQMRRIAALRRELHRMRNGFERVVSGLRELGEEVPDETNASNVLSELDRGLESHSGLPSREEAQRAIDSVTALTAAIDSTQTDSTLARLQARVDEASSLFESARQRRSEAAAEHEAAQAAFATARETLDQARREQRSTENYMRTFGSREEMAQQGESYVSPIGNLFGRAEERFRAAEAVRREERTLRQVLEDENSVGGPENAARLAELQTGDSDVWGVPRSATPVAQLHQNAFDEMTTQQPMQATEIGVTQDIVPEVMLRPVSFHDRRAWRFCAENLLAALRREELSAPREDEFDREDVLANMDLSVAYLNSLSVALAGQPTESQLHSINQLVDNISLMWKCGVPLAYTRHVRYHNQEPQPVRGIVEEWCLATGTMAMAYQASSAVRDIDLHSDRERDAFVRRLERGEQTRLDLDTIHHLIDDPLARDCAAKVLDGPTPEEWWLEDAEFMVDHLTANSHRRPAFVPFVSDQRWLDFVSHVSVASQHRSPLQDEATEFLRQLLSNDDLVWCSGLATRWAERRKLSVLRGERSIFFDEAIPGILGLRESYVDRAWHVNRLLGLELAREAWIADPDSMLLKAVLGPEDATLFGDRVLGSPLTLFVRNCLQRLWNEGSSLICNILNLRPSAAERLPTTSGPADPMVWCPASDTYSHAVAVLVIDTALQDGAHDMYGMFTEDDLKNLLSLYRMSERRHLQENQETAGPELTLAPIVTQTIEEVGWYRMMQRRHLQENHETAGPELTIAPIVTPTTGELGFEVAREEGLDAPDSGRPQPKDEDEMQMMLDCKICFTQVADVACLPCGHLVMCRWCSDQHSPTSPHDRTRPLMPTSCPVCRKRVRSKVKVFRA